MLSNGFGRNLRIKFKVVKNTVVNIIFRRLFDTYLQHKILHTYIIYLIELSNTHLSVVLESIKNRNPRVKICPKFQGKNLSLIPGWKFVQNLSVKICPKFKGENSSEIFWPKSSFVELVPVLPVAFHVADVPPCKQSWHCQAKVLFTPTINFVSYDTICREKGLFTPTINYVLRRVVRHHATQLGWFLTWVAWQTSFNIYYFIIILTRYYFSKPHLVFSIL
jgi:hypothetical protein